MLSVAYMGHIITVQGLSPDPDKVKAVQQMPRPTDVQGVQRLLGAATYLAKFMPRLSDVCDQLRHLTDKEVVWLDAQAADLMDPFQFAYQRNRSVDDAILYVLNNIYSHLDKPGHVHPSDVLWFFVSLQYHPAASPCRQTNAAQEDKCCHLTILLTAHSMSNSVIPLNLMWCSLTRGRPREQSGTFSFFYV